jgi:hypothetical protein
MSPPARRLPEGCGPTRRVGGESPMAQRIRPAVRSGPRVPRPARRPRRVAGLAVTPNPPPGGLVGAAHTYQLIVMMCSVAPRSRSGLVVPPPATARPSGVAWSHVGLYDLLLQVGSS